MRTWTGVLTHLQIDSIMSARTGNEHEASRRLKTEFLVQFDGVMSNENDRIIVMGELVHLFILVQVCIPIDSKVVRV